MGDNGYLHGLAGEVIAAVVEQRPAGASAFLARRITHPDAPAPTAAPLEKAFYFDAGTVV